MLGLTYALLPCVFKLMALALLWRTGRRAGLDIPARRSAMTPRPFRCAAAGASLLGAADAGRLRLARGRAVRRQQPRLLLREYFDGR